MSTNDTNTAPPIGLSGFAISGKTTAANYLEERYGYTRLHIADPLRGMLYKLLDDFGVDKIDAFNHLEGRWKEDVIPELGVTGRHAQITLGTEWGREQIHPDLWQRCWDARAERLGKPAMNDSVRFPNEEAGIKSKGGVTILIVRDGCGPAAFKGGRFMKPVWRWLYQTFGVMRGVHDSERVDRLNPDFVVHNNGSLEQLYAMLDEVVWWVEEDYGVMLKDVADHPIHLYPETVLR